MTFKKDDTFTKEMAVLGSGSVKPETKSKWISEVQPRACRAKSAAKTIANRKKAIEAAEAGLLTGRPSLGCTCNQEQHNSTCRIYMAQKKRESRARLAETRPKPPLPEVIPDPPKENLDWMLDNPLRPRRPEDVGRNRKGNKKRKLFCDR